MTPRLRMPHVLLIVAMLSVAAASGLAQGAPTAAISGTVLTTSVPQRPLARALVTVNGPALKASRTVITNDQGQFAFTDLPSGTFIVNAMRSGFVKTAYGAKRPGRPGTPIDLAAGQRLNTVTIALARGAAITGLVRNATGEPMPGVRVVPSPLDTVADLTTVPIVTDDRGIYRIFGLSPGRYVVRATVTDRPPVGAGQRSDAEMDEILARLQRGESGANAAATAIPGTVAAVAAPATPVAVFGYAPIFFPGTTDPDDAEPITLSEGEDRSGVDFGLRLVRNSAIHGHVVADGAVLSNTYVTLRRVVKDARLASSLGQAGDTRVDAGGAFLFENLSSGHYRILARATLAAPATPGDASRRVVSEVSWAAADVVVADADVSSVSMTLEPSLKFRGTMVFDGKSPLPEGDAPLVKLSDIDGMSSSFLLPRRRPDGGFEIAGILPGRFTVTSATAAGNWTPRSVMVNGRDALDFPLEFSASDIDNAVVTFTDKHTELAGTLQLAPGVPATDYFIVVFAEDRAYWRTPSRRVTFTRPSSDGQFAVRGLPAGDYLIAALTDMEVADLNDADFLARLVAASAKVHIGEGEKTTQNLRIGRSSTLGLPRVY